MLIDCHTHAFTKEDMERLVLSMKKNNIDKSVVIYWPLEYFGERKVPPLKEVIANISAHKNLFLVGSLRLTENKNFERQMEELETALSRKEIYGIKLCLGYEHFFANDPRCDRIYELCTKHGVPVMYHTGDSWGYSKAIFRFANPAYIDDVAVNFPKLKIVICHMGNPCWIKETAEVLYKNRNAFADMAGLLSTSRQNRLEKYYNKSLKEQILNLAAYCESPRKLLFGSDFDIYQQGPYVRFLESFKEFSKEDMEYIRHKNAENLFGI